jgi:hypothetical protein
LKSQIEEKQKDINSLRDWQNKPKNNVIEEIQQKIISAYNADSFLKQFFLKLMNNFLTWEYTGNKDQREAIKKTKIEINKCIKFLQTFK